MTALAVSIMPLENRRDTLLATAVAADRLGYDGFFLPEAWGYDMTVLLAEAAARTGRITLGTGYVTTMGSLYRQSLTRQGFGKEVEAILAANTPKFQAAVPPDAERLLEELCVYGTPDVACARLERWYRAGAALPILLLRASLSPAELDFTLDAFRPILESPAAPNALAPGRAKEVHPWMPST